MFKSDQPVGGLWVYYMMQWFGPGSCGGAPEPFYHVDEFEVMGCPSSTSEGFCLITTAAQKTKDAGCEKGYKYIKEEFPPKFLQEADARSSRNFTLENKSFDVVLFQLTILGHKVGLGFEVPKEDFPDEKFEAASEVEKAQAVPDQGKKCFDATIDGVKYRVLLRQ